jgi:membrane protein implicated in regulation of membrane protease activity
MAIFTMIAAAIYLFIVDLASVGIIYRIVAFMFLAIISIAISVYYTKHKKKTNEEDINK